MFYQELPNDDMFRLWKALDTTEGMRVPKSEFMSFMRRYGGASGKSEKVPKAALRRNQPERQTKEQLSFDDSLRRVTTDSDHKNDGEVEEQLPERESQSRQKSLHSSADVRPGTESTHPPSTAASARMSTPRRTPGLTGVTAPPGDAVGRGIETPTGEQSEAFDVSLSLQRLGTQTAIMSKPHGTFTPEQDPALKMVAERLAEALMAYLHKRGVHCSTTIAGWHRFFSDMDADDSGRATFAEMEDAFQRCLSHARVSRYELLMLWRRLDADGSGEVSLDEFVKMMYRYELAMWPRSSDAELARVVKVVSAAISRWHHVEGNWYKVFLFIDTTGTGTITFEDLQKFLRGTYPGLHLDREELPSDDMFRLWKALDTSARMRVPKSEFMSFMRRYGGASGKSEKVSKALPRNIPKDDSKGWQTPRKVNSEESGHARTQSFMAAMHRNQRERQKKAGAQLSAYTFEAEEEAAQSIMDRLSHYTVEQLMSAYDGWGLPWIGVVSEWEWQLLVRRLLGFDEDHLDDTVLHSFWTCIDQQLTGYVLGLGGLVGLVAAIDPARSLRGVTARCEPRQPLSASEARRVVELFDRMMLDEEYGDIRLYDLREDEEHFVEAVGGDATYGELSFDLLEWFLAQLTELQPEAGGLGAGRSTRDAPKKVVLRGHWGPGVGGFIIQFLDLSVILPGIADTEALARRAANQDRRASHQLERTAAGDLLQMMRIGRREVAKSSPRQDLCLLHPPHPDTHASNKLQKQGATAECVADVTEPSFDTRREVWGAVAAAVDT
eukprot:s578_g16.t1